MKTEIRIIYSGNHCDEECGFFHMHKEFPQLNSCSWYNGAYIRGCITLEYEGGQSCRHESCIDMFGGTN